MAFDVNKTTLNSNDDTTITFDKMSEEFTHIDMGCLVSNLGGVSTRLTDTFKDNPRFQDLNSNRAIFPFILEPNADMSGAPFLRANANFGVMYDTAFTTKYVPNTPTESVMSVPYNYQDGVPADEHAHDYHQFLFMDSPIVKHSYSLDENGNLGIGANTISEVNVSKAYMPSLFESRVKYLMINLSRYIYNSVGIFIPNLSESYFIDGFINALSSQIEFDNFYNMDRFVNQFMTDDGDIDNNSDSNTTTGFVYNYNELCTSMIYMGKAICSNIYNVYIMANVVDNQETGLIMKMISIVEPAVIEFIKNVIDEFLFCYFPAACLAATECHDVKTGEKYFDIPANTVAGLKIQHNSNGVTLHHIEQAYGKPAVYTQYTTSPDNNSIEDNSSD